MFQIRNYRKSDFEMISKWWKDANEPGPLPGMMLEESTFILFVNDIPAYTVTLYLTNCKEVVYAENFARNPDIKNKEAAQVLADYMFDFAKKAGYKRVICLSYKEKLKDRYQELGFTKTLDNLSSFVKEI